LRLRGFGPLGAAAVLVILLSALAGPTVSAVLIFGWSILSRTPLGALGFRRPSSWPLTFFEGVALGVVLKVLLKAIVMPLFGAPAVNVAYHHLVGNTAALPVIISTVVISAGFSEELFFRGYLFERVGTLLGRGKAALGAAVVVSTALFAAAHYLDQGLPGVEQAAVTGLVFGGVYLWRQQIWIPMIAHAAFDLTAAALIYLNLEEAVARMLFR
jgi:membrane protease YdiL (CAAX protease family)